MLTVNTKIFIFVYQAVVLSILLFYIISPNRNNGLRHFTFAASADYLA